MFTIHAIILLDGFTRFSKFCPYQLYKRDLKISLKLISKVLGSSVSPT